MNKGDKVRIKYHSDKPTGMIIAIVYDTDGYGMSDKKYRVRFDQNGLCPTEMEYAAGQLELITTGPVTYSSYMDHTCRCGTKGREVESGFNHTETIWWCDNCRDEVK